MGASIGEDAAVNFPVIAARTRAEIEGGGSIRCRAVSVPAFAAVIWISINVEGPTDALESAVSTTAADPDAGRANAGAGLATITAGPQVVVANARSAAVVIGALASAVTAHAIRPSGTGIRAVDDPIAVVITAIADVGRRGDLPLASAPVAVVVTYLGAGSTESNTQRVLRTGVAFTALSGLAIFADPFNTDLVVIAGVGAFRLAVTIVV